MRILLTGSGFLAKEFIDRIGSNNIFRVPRKYLNDVSFLEDIITVNNISYIIHTSWASVGKGGEEDFNFNMKVNDNLCRVGHMVDKIFIFGSGIETMPYVKERRYYQRAKQLINDKSRKQKNMINLRLFGCFGKHEEPTRFIAQSLSRLKNGLPVKVNQNKNMDFFYVGDLLSIIQHYMESTDILPRDVDCVYPKSEYSDLGGIGNFLSSKYGVSDPVIFDSPGYNKAYAGDPATLASLKLSLKGLIKGIEEIYG